MVAAVLVVAACTSGGSTAVDPPAATERPTPRPTPDPWPARFESHLCAAIDQFAGVQDDLESLTSAASDLDIDGVSLYASSTSAGVQIMDTNLEIIASDYLPARPLMVGWRRANRVLIEALDLIEQGARSGSSAKLERGSDRLLDATKLIIRATPLIEEFQTASGFECS